MWIFPRNPWRFHYRIRTNRSWNDGVNFDIPSQFRHYKEPLHIRILYHAVGNQSKMTFFVNDIIVTSKDIGSFQRVSNQKFNSIFNFVSFTKFPIPFVNIVTCK